jgi:hypothetical protein
VAREVTEDHLAGKNAEFAGADDLSDLVLEYDRVLNF